VGVKTRGNYTTGAKECGDKCKCLLCKRKKPKPLIEVLKDEPCEVKVWI